jgi:pyruvate-formate lyase-activating enzyme
MNNFFHQTSGIYMKCSICEMYCDIKNGGIGSCGMVARIGNTIQERYPNHYLAAVETAIESMPMVHYHPRGKFLQVCTVGCNFKCHGCVSHILTDHLTAIEGAFQEITPDQIIQKAICESCIGIMFCFNEPTVSFFTFLRLAQSASEKGLLVGCSTNGYFTESSLNRLIPYLDFVNFGLKGTSDLAYQACGVQKAAPILRNLRMLFHRGVYVEVSSVYRKNSDAEIESAARFVASISKDIPFQIMRFIPFGDAAADSEPSVWEAESICRNLRKILNYVYLFNSPGSDYLNSRCPHCGTYIMERGFFGPMSSNLYRYLPEARCNCGFKLPIKGKIHESEVRESGYFGGYRTINALNMIRSILGVIGVTDSDPINAVMTRVIKEDFIKTLYERLNRIDAYLDTVDYFAEMTDHTDRAKAYREYVSSRVAYIEKESQGVQKPTVYCALSHPLIAMFDEKMESRLIETAGGCLTNRLLERDGRPGITISKDQFCMMSPDIIIVSSAAAWPVEDFIAFCNQNRLDVPAIKSQSVFHLHPYRASTNPDWILGLLRLANIIHPEVFRFKLRDEADRFYQEFYGVPFDESLSRNLIRLGLKRRLKNRDMSSLAATK